jgi:hypothetical protein
MCHGDLRVFVHVRPVALGKAVGLTRACRRRDEVLDSGPHSRSKLFDDLRLGVANYVEIRHELGQRA